MKYACVNAVVVVLLAIPGHAQRFEQATPDGQALEDFDKRVKAYAALRDDLERDGARPKESDHPQDIVAGEQALVAKIQAARATAKRGDMFPPVIEQRFRALLSPEMRGTRGQNTRGIIKDEGPGAGGFPFTVNGVYPKDQPLGSVPANILAVLPPLPENLEYRFIDRHLVLRDTRANLILDYIPNAIS